MPIANIIANVLIVLLFLVLGYFNLTRPLAMLRLVARWPRFVTTRLLPGLWTHPSYQQRMAEIFGPDPEQSAQVRRALVMNRLTGAMLWFLALTFGCVTWFSLANPQ